MERLNILVHGALGKMGQEVLKALCRDPGLQAVAAVDIKAKSQELLLPDGSSSIKLSTDIKSAIDSCKPDVVVDFTIAEAAMPALRTALINKVAVVTGTTGFSDTELGELHDLCQSQGIGAVVASNFSVAAAVMVHLSKIAAGYFDYAEIIEMHHEQKVDAPSGTALTTARGMIEARGKPFIYAGVSKETVSNSRGGELDGIAMHSVRMPGMLAHQEVILGEQGQTLRIRLDQINREAFMPGVIMAIKKVVGLKEAVFGLDKLLGL